MFKKVQKKWVKYSKKELLLPIRIIDFIWRKYYRPALFILWIAGVFFIIYIENIIYWSLSKGWLSMGIENISANEKILILLYYSTLVLLGWYSRETFDIKEIQNKQIEELRKSRCLEKMPMVRLVSWDIKKKNLSLLKKEGFIPQSKEEENYYKIVYKNIGEDWAFIKEVNFWVSNSISSNQEKISIEYPWYKKTLYKDEEDEIATYSIKIKKDGYFLFPSKLEVVFNDRYNNEFKYTAKKQAGPSEPTPFLGIRDFIEEDVIYPPNLR